MAEVGDGDEVGRPECQCKVGKTRTGFGVSRTDLELGDRWRTGQASVRDLQRRFNLEVLRTAVEDEDVWMLDGEVENLYRLLTDDDVSEGMRTQARNRLRREGIDVERLTDAFVSHQTMYRHLRNCLDVEPQDDVENTVESAIDRLRRLEARTEAVSRDTVESLDENGHVTFGDPDVLVSVTVICRECGAQADVLSAVRDGGCECSSR